MPQITNTTSPTLWSPCLRYYGGPLTPKMIPDTRFCSPLPPLLCFNLPTSKKVSHIIWETTELQAIGEGYKPVAFCPSDTVPESRVFSVLLGPLLHDVVLRNITFFTQVLTVEESNARGFTVQEHHYSNGTKSISVLVPFDADIVLKHVCEIYRC